MRLAYGKVLRNWARRDQLVFAGTIRLRVGSAGRKKSRHIGMLLQRMGNTILDREFIVL